MEERSEARRDPRSSVLQSNEGTANRDRNAATSLIVGASAALVSLVFPGGPILGLVAVVVGVRTIRAGTRSSRRWQAWAGVALGCLSFLIVAGWAADGFK